MSALPSIPLKILLNIFRNLGTTDVIRLGMVNHGPSHPQACMIYNQLCVGHVKISTPGPPRITTSGLTKCRGTFGRSSYASSPPRI